MKTNRLRRCGFSLVEILVVIAVIGVLAGVTIPVITGVPQSAKKEKLEQDVVLVNNAIDAYLASGGDPAGLTAGNVIAALKNRVYGGMAAEMMGPQGPFLDPTVATNPTDFEWSAVFTGSPRPRFVVVQGTQGVIFGTGPATEIGGVAERADADRTTWLWSYAEATPPPLDIATSVPSTATDSARTFGAALTRLQPPVFSPPGGTFPLGSYASMDPLELENPNPEGSSRVFFAAEAGGSFSAYNGPVTLQPGQIAAAAVSLDPSRYSNSETNIQTYIGQPVLTWSNTNTALTYAQAASGGFSVSVSADGPGPFGIFYNSDNSSLTTNSPAIGDGGSIVLTPDLWTSETLTLQAAALIDTGETNAAFYTDSAPASTFVSAIPTVLDAPVITPVGQVVFGSLPVSIAAGSNNPADARIYYTYSTDAGAEPTPETGMLYSGPFVVSEFGVNELKYVKARAYGPTNLAGIWFTESGVAGETYQGLNFDYYSLDGVLVGGGRVANNASLDGSVVLVSVEGQQPNVTFDNNSVLTGDIYAPGTPTVYGVSSDRIINLDGATSPTNYSITINKADFAGKVYRRITPVTMPIVELPTGLTSYGAVSAGTQTLAPGYYSSVTLGNGAEITLGVAGATEPSVYLFDTLSLGNNAKIKVVGPVVLTLNPGSANTVALGNGMVVGNSAHPEWLQVNMFSGNILVGNNSAMYGSILNPNGTVSFQQNAIFVGGVTAKYINIENNATGVSFSLPPPS
jgi:prepilin-type N-terminal cleavage/methylation domain-containing protein